MAFEGSKELWDEEQGWCGTLWQNAYLVQKFLHGKQTAENVNKYIAENENNQLKLQANNFYK